MEFTDFPKNQPVFIRERIDKLKDKNPIIKSFVEKWNIKLSNSEIFKNTESRLQQHYHDRIDKANDKLYFI